MTKRIKVIIIFFLLLHSITLYSQVDSSLKGEEIEVKIDLALDQFSSGEYQNALVTLNDVLKIDPENKRAKDLIKSINELYNMETKGTAAKENESFVAEQPDFHIVNEEKKDEPEEELDKPDFSVRDENAQLLLPEETRSILEISLSPNLVMPWNIGEDSVVFPIDSGYSMSLNGDINYYFNRWDRILGFNATYSLFLLNTENGGLAHDKLHIVDLLFQFRTFFSETVDTKIIFKFGIGYRGYFANGYQFYTIERSYLNSVNMAINLEAPLLYLFWDREFLKRLVFDIDMNLLFFPELNTLNLFDFKVSGELRFSHFSVGIHFGAYSIITPEKVEYLWMTGASINLFF
ncbi:MAG: hypothetical protein PF518_16565 [Spirochaetaceae bacterium]|jgi:hypothetical protein|nr:hypothetical protein [Spirochaetaceae bacterium]